MDLQSQKRPKFNNVKSLQLFNHFLTTIPHEKLKDTRQSLIHGEFLSKRGDDIYTWSLNTVRGSGEFVKNDSLQRNLSL